MVTVGLWIVMNEQYTKLSLKSGIPQVVNQMLCSDEDL